MPKVVFVCHGNICRSPMAERVARKLAAEQGLDAEFTSAGVSTEELGNPIDPRAVRVLKAGGYQTADHRAHQVTAQEIRDADLVVAAEQYHLDRMQKLAPEATNLHLFSEYDPQAEPGDGLSDPWYGSADGFNDTLAAVERSMPALFDEIRSISRA